MTVRPKLLFVDDEEEILDLLVLAFRDCDSRRALDMDRALEALNREQFDVLVTDIKMPGGSGFDLIEAARRTHPELPIVVITGHHQEMTDDTKANVHQWILKPFNIEAIREAVIGALKK